MPVSTLRRPPSARAVSSPWLRIMPSEIREKPLPTPHPDQPRTPGAAGEGARKRGEEPEKTQEFDPDEWSTIPSSTI